jgi:diguanylate cyclase (GGDEF)-like protein
MEGLGLHSTYRSVEDSGVKRFAFLAVGGISVGLSSLAVLFGLGEDPTFNATTVASIALPALVAGFVLTAYIAWDIRQEKDVEGTVKELSTQLVRKEIQIDRLSTLDELTGLLTRKQMVENLDIEWKRALRFGRTLALLLIQIDDPETAWSTKLSKNYLLSEVGSILRANVRAHDVACRYDSERLAVLLPETNGTQACVVAGKIRSQLTTHEFFGRRFGAALGLTLSQGIVVGPSTDLDAPDALLKAAESALLDARAGGNDQVRLHGATLAGRPHVGQALAS